jgi:uncharacterized OsmC-like protein
MKPESGGSAFGATPYELVASGLAACTAMTLRLYADRKMDLREVFVHISYEKSHSEDCLNCNAAMSKIDKFMRELKLVGDLDAEQRMRLLEIADKCPVPRTIKGVPQNYSYELERGTKLVFESRRGIRRESAYFWCDLRRCDSVFFPFYRLADQKLPNRQMRHSARFGGYVFLCFRLYLSDLRRKKRAVVGLRRGYAADCRRRLFDY